MTKQTKYAVWEEIPTYMVVYGPGEGQGSGDYDEVEEGTEYTVDSYENFGSMVAPDGKQFAYWSVRIGSAMSEEVAQKQAGSKITVTANTYLIAIWEDIEAVEHTISFAAGGGSGSMAAVVTTEATYTLPANGFTAPAGKQFKCWSVGGVETNIGASIAVTGDVTVTAIWEDIPHSHDLEAIAYKAPTQSCGQNLHRGEIRTQRQNRARSKNRV